LYLFEIDLYIILKYIRMRVIPPASVKTDVNEGSQVREGTEGGVVGVKMLRISSEGGICGWDCSPSLEPGLALARKLSVSRFERGGVWDSPPSLEM